MKMLDIFYPSGGLDENLSIVALPDPVFDRTKLLEPFRLEREAGILKVTKCIPEVSMLVIQRSVEQLPPVGFHVLVIVVKCVDSLPWKIVSSAFNNLKNVSK